MKKTYRSVLAATAVITAMALTACGTTTGTTAAVGGSQGMHGATPAELNGKVYTETEVDREDGTVEYEYTENGTEFEVEVDAATGAILKTESEPADKEPTPAATKLTLDEARAKAIEHAKVDESTLYDVSAELDDGVYDIEFSSKGTEYNYKISPTTGEILNNYTEVDDDYAAEQPKPETKPETATKISLAEAKKIAYDHAGVSESSAYDKDAEWDDGAYDIEFSYKGTEHNYTISSTGEILKNYTEVDDDYVKPTTKPAATPKPETSTKISLDKAKSIAYNHAGVSESKAYDKDAEWDDGAYDVEFSYKGKEYNYRISKTGEILKHYTEVDDDYVAPKTETKTETKTQSKNISKSKAKSIALNHAGVSASSIRGYEIELDDGVYEISFEKGKYEYEYEVNAKTGKIVKAEKERDD